jgi:hypothetical protein
MKAIANIGLTDVNAVYAGKIAQGRFIARRL